MRRSLAVKILAFLAVAMLVVMVAAWFVASTQEDRIVRRELDRTAVLLADTVDYGISATMLAQDKDAARELALDLTEIDPIMRVVVFAPDGRSWYDTSPKSVTMELASVARVARVADTGERAAGFARRSGIDVYEVLSPISSKEPCFRCHQQRKNLGVVGVVMATGESRARLAADRRFLIGTDLVAVTLMLAVLGLALTAFVVRPLGRLAGVVRAIAEGDLSLRADVSRADEVGELGRSFNEMTDRLEQQICDLESTRAELQETIERVGEAISSAHRMEDLVDVVAREAAKIAKTEAATVMFLSEQGELVVCGARGVSPEVVADYNRTPLKGSDPLIQAHLGTRGSSGGRFDPAEDVVRARLALLPGAVCHHSVPITLEGKLYGVVSLASRDPGCVVTEDARRLLQALASQGALAVDQIRLNEQAKVLAVTDGLTGLYNHRYFHERLASEIERADRFGHPLSLIMLDVDHFKEFNDRHGHLAGDAVLEGIGAVLRRTTRRVDIAARYGGEEFAIILIETGLDEATAYAERLRKAVRGDPLAPDVPGAVDITVSLGVASFPEHGDRREALIAAADVALYTAKERGRDLVVTAGAADVDRQA